MKASIIIFLIWAVIVIAIGTGWVKNIVKLTRCDFESPYKAEVMHGLGIIPPIGAVMGWITFEEEL
ncbi:MAG: hypothetical protein GY821_12865 [Gammaproteobacteria bacterium]|nr:hypothetical protein [Gammaproteobacteria bacterium]